MGKFVFEKYKPMSELISTIQAKESENQDQNDDEEKDESVEIETTALRDIEEFNKWAKTQASKDLTKYKDLTSICDVEQLRLNISSLNQQQRRLFDIRYQ